MAPPTARGRARGQAGRAAAAAVSRPLSRGLLLALLLGSCRRGGLLPRAPPFAGPPGRVRAPGSGRGDRPGGWSAADVARRAAPDRVDEGVRVRAAITYEFDDGDPPDYVDLNPAMEFVCGRGDLAPGLDAGVRGMAVGETRELRFGAGEPLFGPRSSRKVVEVLRASLPACEVGDVVPVGEDAGGGRGLVQSLSEGTATLDLNHPLAGKAVTVWVSVLRCEEVAPLGGVQVATIAPGDSKTYARYGDLVTLHCVVTATRDGKVLESSRLKGEPLRFRVGSGELAADWEEGILRMSLGERATVRVPAPTGAAGGRFREALVLDVEVLGIVSELELAF